MKKILVAMIGSFLIPLHCMKAQSLDSFLTIDSKAGFSTNTFLNPFLSEWDRTENSGYAMVSPIGQLFFSDGRFSMDVTGGFVFEPFFDDRDTWHGGLAVAEARYRVGRSVILGVETGGSYFSSFFTRQLFWMQPKLTWQPSLFTKVSFKAGSTFRDYENFREEDFDDRLDLYAVEFETWPALNWQIQGGIFGNFNTSLSDNLSSNISVRRVFSNSLRISLRVGADRFSNEIVTGGDGPGGPPFGGFPTETLTEETDVLFKTGAAVSYELFPAFSVTMNADHVSLFSTGTQTLSDVHLSAGVRYTLPISGIGGKREGAEPNWKLNGKQVLILKVDYKGSGILYLTGDFNDWEKPGIAMNRQKPGQYAASISPESGAYEYKILLVENGEERWIDFTADTFTVNDGFGGENGVIIIE
ncbi:MAG TPA: hypothetical protein VKM36_07425 [Balneolaceae bacterium]|nr:hypothetical protein [Balneolaceae bacterium]